VNEDEEGGKETTDEGKERKKIGSKVGARESVAGVPLAVGLEKTVTMISFLDGKFGGGGNKGWFCREGEREREREYERE
jgi:hypothetical protein